MRTLITDPPFPRPAATPSWEMGGIWPAKWISCPDAGAPPFVTAYRNRFALTAAGRARVHVTADERYELFLDGERIGRGSERGDVRHWFFETYDLDLAAGEHVLVARVWALGAGSPMAPRSTQLSTTDEISINLAGGQHQPGHPALVRQDDGLRRDAW